MQAKDFLIGIELAEARTRDLLRPPPDLTISQWADRYRRLSPEASAEPGEFSTSRAEYQRGIMDAISDAATSDVVVRTSSQVGKTTILENVIGYYVSQDPAPLLVIQPTLEMAETFSKDRLAPMLRDTPILRGTVKDARARDSGNTLLHKQFAGGHITMAGANSPASLASRPIRVLLCDEVDRYPLSAGAEGDPVTLGTARLKTFWNRKRVLVSTPTVKGASRIDQAYEESDQREFWVPCRDCGDHQVLQWKQVRWDAGGPESARYVCEHCGTLWGDAERLAAIGSGEWRARKPFGGVAGFALSELYSPWSTLREMARAFLDAKHSRSVERMRAWTNTTLGQSYEEDGERLDETGLADRAEVWEGIPEPVLLTTCGVDVQDDRVEVELVGWGADAESWSIDYRTIFGDPSAKTLWADLERYLLEHRPAATCIDSGGHHTQAVYEFCRGRYKRRVYAIKGMAGAGRPVWPKAASRNNKGRVNLFMLGVDAAKEQVYGQLKLTTHGPGYCHFPVGRDDQYYAGLASEVVSTRFSKGFPIREWKRRSGVRNEPLDCRVYAYAALCSLNVNWTQVARSKARKDVAAEQQPAPAPQQEAPPPPVVDEPRNPVKPFARARSRRSGWVSSW